MKLFILSISLTLMASSLCATLQYKLLKKEDLHHIQDFLVQQRIREFKEYPYLYQADIQEENQYAQWLVQLPDTALAVAYEYDQPVGFISGTAFKDFDTHFKGSIDTFKSKGLNPEDYFYLAEAIITPSYQKIKLCGQLYRILENHVRNLGYKAICFVTESHASHPLKPRGYDSLEDMYHYAGFQKSDISIKFNWLTIQERGEPKDEEHILVYWFKYL